MARFESGGLGCRVKTNGLGFRELAKYTIVKYQMEKKMEHEMETRLL